MMVRVLDHEGRGIFFNQCWLSFRRQPLEAECGDGWRAALHPDDAPAVLALREREPSADAEVAEYRLLRADGEYRWMLEWSMPWQLEDAPPGYIGSCVDITERRATEEHHARGEEVFRALAEAMPALVLTTNADGDVNYCNRHLLEYCGTTLDGIRRDGWVQYVHPEDAEEGRERWTEQVGRMQPFALEYRIRRADGEYRWHRTHTGPIIDDGGNVVAWIGISIDIDALRRAEREARHTAEQLARAQEAKDEFLTLVSHELRTPLTTIFGNAQILHRFGEELPPDVVRSSLGDIEAEANRLQLLVDNMFLLARSDLEQNVNGLEPVLLSRAVARVVEQHRARFPERTITVSDEVGPWPVRGDGDRIEHVLRNLVANAEKFSPPGTPIEVALDRSENDASVRVLDRGAGMSEEDESRAFEMFYRGPATASYVAGAGIGLSVCKQLIEAQGGIIWIRRRDGGGAEAGFTLPLEPTEASDEH